MIIFPPGLMQLKVNLTETSLLVYMQETHTTSWKIVEPLTGYPKKLLLYITVQFKILKQ